MPLPAGLTTITVTGHFPGGDGVPRTGSVVFIPTSDLVYPSGDAIIPAASITAPLYAGMFSIVLLCTDNAGVSPTPWYWSVTRNIDGETSVTQFYAIPSTLGASVDLADLVEVTPGPAMVGYVLTASQMSVTGTPSAGQVLTATSATTAGWEAGGGAPSNTVQPANAFNIASAAGTATAYARGDHQHGTPALPTASTSAAGVVQFESSTGNLQAAGVAALGTNGKTVDSGHTHPLEPWRFSVMAQGAKGDGKISITGATTASSTTITIGESVFTAGDVGKAIMVKNALNANNVSGQTTSVGTITAVNSATSVTATWNTTPTQTATGLQVLWATDDTAAIQSAIAAANTYAQSHGLAEVFFPSPPGLFYGVAGALKNTDGATAAFNSQLTVPINPEHNEGVTLVFRGVGDGGQARYWNTTYPAFSGSPLVSFGVFTSSGTQSTNITNNGNPSVIGSGTGKFGYGVGTPTPLYSNTCVVFQDISILTTHSNSGWTYSAANMFGAARFHAWNFSYGTTGVVELFNGNSGDFTNVTLLSGGLSLGLLLPSNGNNANNYLNNVVCNGGYTYALLSTEHTVGKSVTLLYCWSGICPCGNYADSGTGAVSALHASWYDQLCVEACTYHVNVFGVGASGIGPIFHAIIDTEGTIQLRDTTSGTSLAAALGEIRFTGSPSAITPTNATGLRIIKEQNVPGVAASPPALSANTAVMNSLWRPAMVYLVGGTTVTTIQVSQLAGSATAPAVSTVADFTAAGTISAPFPVRLGPGQWIKVNCAVLPTATWVLD